MDVLQNKRHTGEITMKINHVIKILALSFLGTGFSSTCFADTGLSSSEIKKVRYLSRALLQSRALEKKRIDTEVAPQRADIKKMEDSLDGLISSERASLSRATLTPANNGRELRASSGVMFQKLGHVDGKTVLAGPDGSVIETIDQSVVQVQPEVVVQSIAVLPDVIPAASSPSDVDINKKHRIDQEKRVKASMDVITKIRTKKEDKAPSRLAFWKKKSKEDLRNEHIVVVAKDVEQQLTQMTQKNQVDMQMLKALKKKLSLKRLTIDFEQIEPTIKTRTRHRVQ